MYLFSVRTYCRDLGGGVGYGVVLKKKGDCGQWREKSCSVYFCAGGGFDWDWEGVCMSESRNMVKPYLSTWFMAHA